MKNNTGEWKKTHSLSLADFGAICDERRICARNSKITITYSWVCTHISSRHFFFFFFLSKKLFLWFLWFTSSFCWWCCWRCCFSLLLALTPPLPPPSFLKLLGLAGMLGRNDEFDEVDDEWARWLSAADLATSLLSAASTWFCIISLWLSKCVQVLILFKLIDLDFDESDAIKGGHLRVCVQRSIYIRRAQLYDDLINYSASHSL